MTAVHAFHPAENDDPYPRPTTAELLDRLCTQAETTRAGVDRILTGLNEGACPECGVAHHGVDHRRVLQPLPVVVGAVRGVVVRNTGGN